MEHRIQLVRRLAFVLMSIILAIIIGILILNPFNWFVKKADGFTFEKFRHVRVGMSAEEVKNILGEPIRIVDVKANTRCDGCKIYLYMGDPLPGVLFYSTAEVTISATGKVVQVIQED